MLWPTHLLSLSILTSPQSVKKHGGRSWVGVVGGEPEPQLDRQGENLSEQQLTPEMEKVIKIAQMQKGPKILAPKNRNKTA